MKIHVNMYLGGGYLEAFSPDDSMKHLLRLPLNNWSGDATGDIARALARAAGLTGKLDTYLKIHGPGRYVYEVTETVPSNDDFIPPEQEWVAQ